MGSVEDHADLVAKSHASLCDTGCCQQRRKKKGVSTCDNNFKGFDFELRLKRFHIQAFLVATSIILTTESPSGLIFLPCLRHPALEVLIGASLAFS